MEIIASVFDEKSTESQVVDQLEVWATDVVHTRDQMTIASAMKNFCSKMYPNLSAHLELRALRKMVADPGGNVKFGAVLLAHVDVFSVAEIEEMKKGCGQLSTKLKAQNATLDVDLFSPVPEADVFPDAQQAAIAELEKNHGGQRLARPVEIFIQNNVRVVLRDQILQRPDMPIDDLPLTFQGLVFSSRYELHDIEVTPNIGRKGDFVKGGRIKIGCADPDLFERCMTAGFARELLSFQIRRVPTDNGNITNELETITLVKDGDAWPIDQ
jgi:hypothetical protein